MRALSVCGSVVHDLRCHECDNRVKVKWISSFLALEWPVFFFSFFLFSFFVTLAQRVFAFPYLCIQLAPHGVFLFVPVSHTLFVRPLLLPPLNPYNLHYIPDLF